MLFLYVSKCSRAIPVPFATQKMASSARLALTPVLLNTSSGKFLNSEEPPVIIIPESMISAESSGGVSCKTSLMAFIMSFSSLLMAFTISFVFTSAEVKTNEIVKAISKELKDMIKAIKDVLQETPPELSADIIDSGIIMTGGSSELRNFPELVFRRTGVKASLADEAIFCVAKGTGIALEHLDTYKKSIVAKR